MRKETETNTLNKQVWKTWRNWSIGAIIQPGRTPRQHRKIPFLSFFPMKHGKEETTLRREEDEAWKKNNLSNKQTSPAWSSLTTPSESVRPPCIWVWEKSPSRKTDPSSPIYIPSSVCISVFIIHFCLSIFLFRPNKKPQLGQMEKKEMRRRWRTKKEEKNK